MNPDNSLSRWINRRSANLDKATIGQLVTLLELVSSDSVAALGRSSEPGAALSAGVNYRQKLARLERALGVGQLTRRVGKYTKPTEAGIRVAGELRLFLNELRSIEARKAESPTWLLGAGDAWLYGLLLPALVYLSHSRPEWRWEIRNMPSNEIRSGLREGVLHFGFVREGNAPLEGLTVGNNVAVRSYCVVVGDAVKAPKDARELIRWAISEKRPLVQQGSTWRHLRDRVGKHLGVLDQLSQIEPHITCETHPQALKAAEAGASWCIMPRLAGLTPSEEARCAIFDAGDDPDTMVLLNYSRSLKKHADGDRVWEELQRAIRVVMNQEP